MSPASKSSLGDLRDVNTPAREQPDKGEATDGGWGWIIVISSFVSNVICFVVRAAFSILYMEWVQYYNSDKARIGGIWSLTSASGSLLGWSI